MHQLASASHPLILTHFTLTSLHGWRQAYAQNALRILRLFLCYAPSSSTATTSTSGRIVPHDSDRRFNDSDDRHIDAMHLDRINKERDIYFKQVAANAKFGLCKNLFSAKNLMVIKHKFRFQTLFCCNELCSSPNSMQSLCAQLYMRHS